MNPKLDRILHWGITRVFLEGGCVVAAVILASRLLSLAVPAEPSPLHAIFALLRNLIVTALALTVYSQVVRVLERRPAGEIALRPGLVQFPFGLALGLAMMATVYGILWCAHVAAFQPGVDLSGLATGFVVMLLAAVFEELLFRAVLFRIVEQRLGTAMGLVVSAAFFGLAHGTNPGATLFSDLAIALEAGALLAAAYVFTRNLWLTIGIHAGWNFAEGPVFGALVSGQVPPHPLLHSTLSGPTLLTGGDFGPEASILAVLVCGLAALIFGILAACRGEWVRRTARTA